MEEKESPESAIFKAPRKGLKNKLIRAMLAVGAFPLLLAMMLSYIQGNKSLENVIGSSFKALAYETSTKIDFIMKEEIHQIRHMATHPTIILSVKGHNKLIETVAPSEINRYFAGDAKVWQEKDPQLAELIGGTRGRVLKSFLRMNTSSNKATRALFITDAKGVLVGSINFYPDFLNASHRFWEKTFLEGADFVFIGDLYKDAKLDEFVFQVAVPILGPDKETIGVFHRVYAAKEFFSATVEPIIFGETGHVMLIDSDGVIIDCPILPTGHQLEDPQLVRAVTGPEADWAQTTGDGHGSEELSIIGYSPLLQTNKMTEQSTGKKWFTFAWQASYELFAPTQKLLVWIAAAGFVSILLILIMGSLASSQIVKPIRTLQNATIRIGRGEDVETLNIKTGDEIEQLANEVNTMNQMIKKSFTGLENQVREKSQEVLTLQEYMESILMSVPDVLLILDKDLKIEYVNSSFEQVTGTQSEEVVGKSLRDLSSRTRGQWEVIAKEVLNYAKNSKIPSAAEPGAENNGDYQPYKPIDPLDPSRESAPEDHRPTLSLGNGRDFIYQFFDVMIQAKEKKRIGLLLREITEEKKLQDQLAMAEKLAGLGRLAAGIAHEMNNPLYSIMGFTEAILEENDQSKIKSYAAKVLNRAKHMASVILNMSGYTRTTAHSETKDVNLNERLDAAIEIAIMASHSNDIQLEKNYQALPLLKAKPEEIQQIFINIIANAVQAMNGKGEIIISSSQLDGNIKVEIHDTGPGIPPEYLSKVFDPFFTTKAQGEGSGLGLNIVHRLVQKYHGQIEVKSDQGKGTTFILTFPVPPKIEKPNPKEREEIKDGRTGPV